MRLARTAAMLALAALIGGALLPAEHVHYAPDGHHAAVVHRHVSHASTSTAIHAGDDDHVQELREAWLAGRPFVLPLTAAVALRAWDGIPPLARDASVVSAALRIDKGPPLPSRVLRGPPLPV